MNFFIWTKKGIIIVNDVICYIFRGVIEALTVFCRLTLPGKIVKYIGERIVFQEVKEGSRVEVMGMGFPQAFSYAFTTSSTL